MEEQEETLTYCLGYDYGTTTSQLHAYDPISKGTKKLNTMLSAVFVETGGGMHYDIDALKASSITVDGIYVRSPKRGLPRIQYDGFINIYAQCPEIFIKNTTREVLKGVDGSYSNAFVTLTIPNAFKDWECKKLRQAVKDAITEANDDAVQLQMDMIPEPIAAAMYYLCTVHITGGVIDKNYVVVCDIGGGTTDLAIVKYTKTNCDGNRKISINFEMVCSHDNGQLGGNDLDVALKHWVVDEYVRKNVEAAYNDIRLTHDVEQLKMALSDGGAGMPREIYMYNNEGNRIVDENNTEVSIMCRYENFTDIIDSYNTKLKKLLETLKCSFCTTLGMSDFNFSDVILLPVGGTSKVKLFQETFRESFDNARIYKLSSEYEACFDCVAQGAAFYSAWRAGKLTHITQVSIKNRIPYRIALLCGLNDLVTCVDRNMEDGEYTIIVYPNEYVPGSNTQFKLMRLEFHDSDKEYLQNEECITSKLGHIEINDPLYSHNRALNSIEIKLTTTITNARIAKFRVVVPAGNSDGSDYVKEFDKDDLIKE